MKEKDKKSINNLLLELQQFLVPSKVYKKEYLKNIANKNNISLKKEVPCCLQVGWTTNGIIP